MDSTLAVCFYYFGANWLSMEFDEAKAQSTGFKKNLKYITVSNSKTGFVVYERVFKWPENTITANLGSLIQSFYQFAREVDDGSMYFIFIFQ